MPSRMEMQHMFLKGWRLRTRAPVLYMTCCSDRFIPSHIDVCFSRNKLQPGEALCGLGVYGKQQTEEGCGVGEESRHSCT